MKTRHMDLTYKGEIVYIFNVLTDFIHTKFP